MTPLVLMLAAYLAFTIPAVVLTVAMLKLEKPRNPPRDIAAPQTSTWEWDGPGHKPRRKRRR